MKLKNVFLYTCLILAATVMVRIQPAASRLALSRHSIPTSISRKISEQYGKLPLRFEVNEGQTASEVKFLSRGPGYTLFLNSDEAVLSLNQPQPTAPGKLTVHPQSKSAVLRMKLIDANPRAEIRGAEQLETKSNYLIGNDPSKWRKNVANFGKVKLSGVYPGVDLVYYGNQRQLEYDFVVSPGADPTPIGLDIAGADRAEINQSGELVLHAAGEEVRMNKPIIYQGSAESRHVIPGGYVLRGDHQIGFEVAEYDHSQPLIIDPTVSFLLFLGGIGPDLGNAITLDSAGNAYVTGQTHSGNFPVRNAVQPFNFPSGDPSTDVFIAKINPTGSSLFYATYIGGFDFAAISVGTAIAVDAAGSPYITGWTTADDYPVGSGFQSTTQGGADVIVSKLSPAGDAFLYSTYLGSAGNDQGFGIAVDASGNAFITGETDSTAFPVTFGPQSANAGGLDAFVVELAATGNSLLFSTYLGGSGDDFGFGIAIDQTGVYVAGGTNSPGFPVTAGTLQTAYQSSEDAFVAKLSPTGVGLLYSTFLGGLGQDEAHGIAVDLSGNVYVTGITGSQNFPTTKSPGRPFQAALSGTSDAFVAKINPTATALLYSTFVGGTGADVGQAIAIDASGNAYVAGYTTSLSTFPQVNPLTTVNSGGGTDGFVTMLSSDGSTAIYSSLIGGTGTDQANGIAVTSTGVAYIEGTTDSQNLSSTAGAVQGSGAGLDSFTMKIGAAPIPTPSITQLTPTSATAGSTNFTLNVTGTNFTLSSVVQWNGSNRPTTFVSSTQLTATLSAADLAAAGTGTVNVVNPGASSQSNFLTFTINPLIVNNPVPVATTLSPSSAAGGAAGFTLTVNGSGFISSSQVLFNNSARPTTFVSSSQLTTTINASDLTTVGPARVSVSTPAPGGGVSNVLTFTVTGPAINTNGTVNGASFSPGAGVAPGSIASVFGSSLSTTTAKSTVRLNGTQAFVYDSFGGQINFQVPWELASQSSATLTVTSSAGVTSAPATVNIVPFSPGIFTVNSSGTGQGAILIASSGEITAPSGSVQGAAARPVKQGEFITIYCTGLGPVTPAVASGQAAPTTPLSTTNTAPTVTIGGSLAPVTSGFFSGLAPGFIGLYQVNVQIPSTAPIGDAIPLSISIGTANSNNVTIAIASGGNPVPTITTLTPSSASVGAGSQSIIVVGTNFVGNSTATFNGSARNVLFLSNTQLILTLNPADLATAGTFPIVVSNPAPGGGASSASNFTVSP